MSSIATARSIDTENVKLSAQGTVMHGRWAKLTMSCVHGLVGYHGPQNHRLFGENGFCSGVGASMWLLCMTGKIIASVRTCNGCAHQEETCSRMIQYKHLRSKSTYEAKSRIFLCLEHCRDFIHKTRRSTSRAKYKRYRRLSGKERFNQELDLIGSTSWEISGSEAAMCIISIIRRKSQPTHLMNNTLCFPKRVRAWSKNSIIFKFSGLGASSSKEPAHQRSGNGGLRLECRQFHETKHTYPTWRHFPPKALSTALLAPGSYSYAVRVTTPWACRISASWRGYVERTDTGGIRALPSWGPNNDITSINVEAIAESLTALIYTEINEVRKYRIRENLDVRSYMGGAPAKLINFPSGWNNSARIASTASWTGSCWIARYSLCFSTLAWMLGTLPPDAALLHVLAIQGQFVAVPSHTDRCSLKISGARYGPQYKCGKWFSVDLQSCSNTVENIDVKVDESLCQN